MMHWFTAEGRDGRPRSGRGHGQPDPCRISRPSLLLLRFLLLLLGLHGLLAIAGCQTESALRDAVVDFTYSRAAVAADHPLASEAGAEILRLGGNAVDAAVATSFCLSVVRPYSCGIGGGGFMLIHLPPATPGAEARAVALDYRETSPAAVGPSYYADPGAARVSRFGVHAVGVPGTVAGLLHALDTYGTLDRATVLAPAIRAAEDGFAADASHVAAVRRLGKTLETHPRHRANAAFAWKRLGREGAIAAGDVVRNPEQARALRLIAARGTDAFYRGPIGAAITRIMAEQGGPITGADLADYRHATRSPLRERFRDLEIVTMPPPSSGGIAMQQILGIFERATTRTGFADLAPNGPRYVHLLAEAMKHAFADRAEWLADPDFRPVPVARLLDPAYLDGRAALVAPDRTRDPYDYGSVTPAPDDAGTSHLCVVDGNGMAVACTETINLEFGSLVCVPEFGFVLNDEMDDFTTVPGAANAFGLRQSDRNLPQPGKRPLSSMSPTIVRRDGRVVVVAGASGGPRIITGTLQAILNCVLFGMTPSQAVAAPRFHHQWMPNLLQFDETWSDAATVRALATLGHEIGVRDEVGVVQLIAVDGTGLRAASDPRKGGRPAGF